MRVAIDLFSAAGRVAADAVVAAKERYFARQELHNSDLPRKIRLATDGFTAGYAVGVAYKELLISGTSNPTKSTAVLLDVLASQLAPHMPGIDVASWYSRGTPALNAGIMFGMHEPSNNRRALVWVWEGLSAHSVGTGISLLQWAYTLGVFRQADSLIEPAMVEMQISDF